MARTLTPPLHAMATQTLTTADYKLYPSPRNAENTVFAHQWFLPYPYALIHLPDYDLRGPASLFAACRLSDMKMGQLVSFALAEDLARFERLFTTD